MNDFSSIDNSFTLKNDYSPKKEKADILDVIEKRRKRHADSYFGIKDQFPREVDEDEKASI